jgi:hypothetical protein
VAFVSWTPTLTTDAQGNGETDFVFESTVPLPLFDVMFRGHRERVRTAVSLPDRLHGGTADLGAAARRFMPPRRGIS